MKYRYLNEAFKKVNTLKASHEKDVSDDEVKRQAKEVFAKNIKIVEKELYQCLCEQIYGDRGLGEDLVYKNYKIYKNGNPLTFEYQIPGLFQEAYDNVVGMSLEKWVDYYSNEFIIYGDLRQKLYGVPDVKQQERLLKHVGPIRDVELGPNNSFIATIELRSYCENFGMTFFPCKLLKVFPIIENEVYKRTGFKIKIKFYITGRKLSWTDIRPDWIDVELPFPGGSNYSIELVNYSKELFDDITDFIGRFDNFSDDFSGELRIVDSQINSLDDLPDFHKKFSRIIFDTLNPDQGAAELNDLRKQLVELGDYTRFLQDVPKADVIILPYGLSPKVIEKISNNEFTIPVCVNHFYHRLWINFNPYSID